jgi:putative hydrolase of the HAD superfamily
LVQERRILLCVRRVLFDFDGTLAYRPGGWSQCLVDVLDEVSPGHEIRVDDIRPYLRDGFPWHVPDRSHVDLSDPDRWWDSMSPLFFHAYGAVGVPPRDRERAITRIRPHYCDPTRFHLYPDSADALERLRRNGWELVILSNHVPELESIVDGVGLGSMINEVFSSALTGYEKPNPQSYRIALGGERSSECVMVGDNLEADVLGAERVGLPAILVRNAQAVAPRFATGLQDAVGLILDP